MPGRYTCIDRLDTEGSAFDQGRAALRNPYHRAFVPQLALLLLAIHSVYSPGRAGIPGR
jgi:hypothetical protein